MQEFTEKDCMQTEKEGIYPEPGGGSSLKGITRALHGADFFCTNIQKQKIPDIPLPIWFPYLLGRHGTAGTGDVGWCAAARTVGGKGTAPALPDPSILGRWIYMDIPQNILDTVFCRMDAMRQGYGWQQIQRKYGAM